MYVFSSLQGILSLVFHVYFISLRRINININKRNIILLEPREDDWTRQLIKDAAHFVRIGKTVAQNRREVFDRGIDILVYLDVGMV